MYHRRINPRRQFVNEINDISERINEIDTQPSGDIVMSGTFSTFNTEMGTATTFSSTGVEENLYDITPPPPAMQPTVSAQPGIFVITWNGALEGDIPSDFLRVNVIGYKIVNNETTLVRVVGSIMSPNDTRFVTTDIAAVGETWQFALESEDNKGNLAEAGVRSDVVQMLPHFDYRRAEFTTTNASVVGSSVLTHSGVAVLDTTPTRTVNNTFCIAHPTIAGAVQFLISGYYSIDIIIVPVTAPGDGTAKLKHSNGELLSVDKTTGGKKHDSQISTIDTYFAANDYAFTELSFVTAHTINVRWRIVCSTFQF